MKKLDQLKSDFISPGVEYRGKPFWSWNGELRGEELVRQAHVMKEMGLGGYFMHSRAGLITEYLGDEWFELINQVADAAEADGMEAWLYDEDRWPSGSAGGKVTVDPQYRMKSLYVYESDIDRVEWNEQSISLFVARIDGIDVLYYEKLDGVSDKESALKALGAAVERLSESCAATAGSWRALRFAIVPDPCTSNYNGTTYIDTMSRKATDKFIEMTHEEYRKRCGDRLGRSIKGIFTDEPHRGHCLDNREEKDGVISCAIFWTDDIFDEFRRRYGYDPEPILPEIFYRPSAEKVARIKLHYIDLGDALFLERFAKPINDWCERNGIIFTGHVLHEDSLMNQTVPEGSVMRFYEYMGYPGMDLLSEGNRCYWVAKQLSSAARQLGKRWLLSELYGCTGWQLDFKGHKAVGDWQALFGVNLRCQHLSWYTMEGQSKRDYPASILHQSPWYKDYSKVEDYFARFGLVMSEGEADCDVLLLNPIESVWCQAYMGWSKWIFNASEDIGVYEKRYAEAFHMLADNQIDFDYGEEEMMSRMASVELGEDGKAILRVGKAKYRVVIVTNMLTVRPSTLALLKSFMEQGGQVIFAGDIPAYVDAVPSAEPEELSKLSGAINVAFDENEIVAAIRRTSGSFVSVVGSDGQTEHSVFAQVRKSFGDDGYAIAVLNTDRENAKKDLTLKIAVPEGYFVEEWDLESGVRYDASGISSFDGTSVSISFNLEGAGTRCFVLTKEKEALEEVVSWSTVAEATVSGDLEYTADEPNVCVLDWVKWRWRGGEWHGETEVLRADREIRSDVGIEWRGGHMLQPWYAKLNDKNEYGELQLEYEFFVDVLPDGEVFLAGERPEFNAYKINGISLASEDVNDFWIDDCFKRMRVPEGALRLGRNTVTVDVTFMRTTNVEAIYLVGNFGVKLDGKKRSLVAPPTLLGCENYANYAMPFYTGSVTYHLTAEHYANVLGADGDEAERIVISPELFTGGCVKITALGKTTVLGWDPYEADVTDAYRSGAPIDITVVGTRRNLFGPLHLYPNTAIGYDPNRFMTSGGEWTDDYSLIDSGLTGILFKAQTNGN